MLWAWSLVSLRAQQPLHMLVGCSFIQRLSSVLLAGSGLMCVILSFDEVRFVDSCERAIMGQTCWVCSSSSCCQPVR